MTGAGTVLDVAGCSPRGDRDMHARGRAPAGPRWRAAGGRRGDGQGAARPSETASATSRRWGSRRSTAASWSSARDATTRSARRPGVAAGRPSPARGGRLRVGARAGTHRGRVRRAGKVLRRRGPTIAGLTDRRASHRAGACRADDPHLDDPAARQLPRQGLPERPPEAAGRALLHRRDDLDGRIRRLLLRRSIAVARGLWGAADPARRGPCDDTVHPDHEHAG